MQTRHINPNHFAAQRVATGFPRDASRLRQFMFFLALVPMCFIRHKIGERIVSVPRILAMDALLLLYALVFAMLFGSNVDQQGAVFAGGIWFVIIFTIVAVIHRTLRWARRQGGEQLETRCMGLSWFGWKHPNGNAERYMDIALSVGLGLGYLLSDRMLEVAGSWLMISGIALFISENYIHALHLDRQDALLNAEAHEQVAAMHLEEQGTSGPKAATPSTPIPTGLDSSMKHLQKQAQQQALWTAEGAPKGGEEGRSSPIAETVLPVARSTELAEFEKGIKRLLFGDAKTDQGRFINGVIVVTSIVVIFLLVL